MQWNDDNSTNYLWNYGRGFFENESLYFPQTCSVCGEHEIHFYAHKGNENDAEIWIWCSNCKRTIYGIISDCPDWYRNYKILDFNKFGSHPQYLEENKKNIDRFINGFIKKFPLSPRMSEEELEVMVKAFEEFGSKGYTDSKCPRCGGNLNYIERGKSGKFRCDDPKCLQLTLRGI